MTHKSNQAITPQQDRHRTATQEDKPTLPSTELYEEERPSADTEDSVDTTDTTDTTDTASRDSFPCSDPPGYGHA